jgi:hypothetical protein
VTLPPCSNTSPGRGPVADAPIVYADEEVARLLGEVERRSGRRRRHQQRAAQTAACLVVAVVAWLSSASVASGEVRTGHHPVAVTVLDVGRVAQFGA